MGHQCSWTLTTANCIQVSNLLGLTTATGSNQARFKSPSPEKSGVDTIRCQHIFYLLFWPKSWNGLLNWAHFLSFLAFWAWINCSVRSLFDRKTFCYHWGPNRGYSLYSVCFGHSAIQPFPFLLICLQRINVWPSLRCIVSSCKTFNWILHLFFIY